MKKFNITDEQIDALRPSLPNIDDLIESDIWSFQDALDFAIIGELGEDYEATTASDKLQKIYDEIYFANLKD